MSRRDFLGLLTRAIIWFCGAVGLAGLIRFLSYGGRSKSTGRYTLERPEAYPLGSGTWISDARLVLFRDEGGFYARSLVCPHLGCVIGREDGGFRCPCHGSRFGEAGEWISGPAKKSLTSVWLGLDEGGRLIVDVRLEVPSEWRLIL